MKSKLVIAIVFFLSLMPVLSIAKGFSYKGHSSGKTHYVRPYVKKSGQFVQGHRAGNPRSKVHCKNNICY